jgi:hypothetical protein
MTKRLYLCSNPHFKHTLSVPVRLGQSDLSSGLPAPIPSPVQTTKYVSPFTKSIQTTTTTTSYIFTVHNIV